MNKLVPMILFYLQSGEKPRHKVTEKIKNYDKELRDEAIEFVVKGKLVKLREKASSVGRTPVYISLTEKGFELASELSVTPRHNSVWGDLS